MEIDRAKETGVRSISVIKTIRAGSLTLFVYGLLGWLYIVLDREVHPHALRLQLTHFAPWPREDTFGEICFAVSLISFFIWNLVRDRRE